MECFGPMSIPKLGGHGPTDRVYVPCGKCVACLSNTRNDWTFRLKKEYKNSLSAYFITFTYDEKNVPLGEGEKQTLCKRDVQLFLKRLRKLVEKGCYTPTKVEKSLIVGGNTVKIRYFIVGEYGGKTNRPHYHGLFFNLPVDVNNMINEIWKLGFCVSGSVTDASIHYVTKYMITRGKEYSGVEKPFAIMSRRPGIGNNYLEDTEKWHKNNKNFYVVNEGGYKQRLPRYYKKKVFSDVEIKKNSLGLQKQMDEKEVNKMQKIRELGNEPFAYMEEQKSKLRRSVNNLNNEKL